MADGNIGEEKVTYLTHGQSTNSPLTHIFKSSSRNDLEHRRVSRVSGIAQKPPLKTERNKRLLSRLLRIFIVLQNFSFLL